MEIYRGYKITENEFRNGKYPATNFIFNNTNDCDEITGTGESISDCKMQINEIWTDRAFEIPTNKHNIKPAN